ncbi:copper chaperone [Staphylococcus condimenti]|uniref:Copper chaperone n=2 Tax=Staphylococcus condimenti TaxID=70255 RepID=A0A143PFY0_9STAP|nr:MULTISPECIES: copper ion binding protein [Staphylococcus]AMY06659.1 heavy metal transport/detoxification protein [Staphylococcus condimenti]APR60541.1 heavy metal transport/detoxification protein [Staphylococcus condimenti]MDK8645824.1 copper ion binding protein [Staphylococcus condimenti]OFP03500.1 heavy metal transport/detoxification protein [Staphylococcus sp. HMSC065E08]PNZ61568.1 copper chaperone [Staphylococcus condimenti]
MEEKQLKVEGMSCGHCKSAVESAVGKIEGVDNVNASPENDTVDVKFNGEANVLSEIEKAIYDAGYDVVK